MPLPLLPRRPNPPAEPSTPPAEVFPPSKDPRPAWPALLRARVTDCVAFHFATTTTPKRKAPATTSPVHTYLQQLRGQSAPVLRGSSIVVCRGLKEARQVEQLHMQVLTGRCVTGATAPVGRSCLRRQLRRLHAGNVLAARAASRVVIGFRGCCARSERWRWIWSFSRVLQGLQGMELEACYTWPCMPCPLRRSAARSRAASATLERPLPVTRTFLDATSFIDYPITEGRDTVTQQEQHRLRVRGDAAKAPGGGAGAPH